MINNFEKGRQHPGIPRIGYADQGHDSYQMTIRLRLLCMGNSLSSHFRLSSRLNALFNISLGLIFLLRLTVSLRPILSLF